MLGFLFIGIGLLVNKVPSLSPPSLEVVSREAANQSLVLSDKKDTDSTRSNDTNTDSLIKINGASQADLESLDGVGPKTAQKIIEGRPYASTLDLLTKHVVSLKLFEQIKKKISL